MQYIYLHGFASGSNSKKAQYFKKKFADKKIELQVLDLNLNDFYNLTVSKQLAYLAGFIQDIDTCLIGSSLGALLSLLSAQQSPTIKKLLLLAPALEIKDLWVNLITQEGLLLWQQQKEFSFYHSIYQQEVPLNYNFVEDLMSLKDRDFELAQEIMIFHGVNDKTIPVEATRRYAKFNPQAISYELDSDHSLENQLDFIWHKSTNFLFKAN